MSDSSSVESSATASDLCVSCGLCCDGTLFDMMEIQPDEVTRAAGNVRTDATGDPPDFRFPCSFLDGACCTIYADRFRQCRAFRCKLLRRFDAGDIAVAPALAHIAEAQRLGRRAREGVARFGATDIGKAVRIRAKHWDHSGDPTERDILAEADARLTALRTYTNDHFRNAPLSEYG